MADAIVFDVTGVDEFVIKVDEMVAALPGKLQEQNGLLEDWLKAKLSEAYGPTLGRSWHVVADVFTEEQSRAVIEAFTFDPVVGYYELGTAAHIIAARKAQALRFSMGGAAVFAKQVHHPGTKPHNKLTRIREEFRQQVHERWAAAIQNSLEVK